MIYYSVQFSCSVVSDSLWPHELQHTRPPCPSPTPVHSDSRPSSRWCHPAISSSVVPFSSCPQSLPAPESFPMSQNAIIRHSFNFSILSILSTFIPQHTQAKRNAYLFAWVVRSKLLNMYLSPKNLITIKNIQIMLKVIFVIIVTNIYYLLGCMQAFLGHCRS